MSQIEGGLVRVGLIGCGTVGGGVVNSFAEGRLQPEGIVLKTVAVRDLSKIRDVKLPDSAELTHDVGSIIDDPNIDAVVELMGGTDLAGEYSERILRTGKHLVTANKALLGERLPDLFDLARNGRTSLSFEASVCGTIPVVESLRHYFRAQEIKSIRGIMNGTTNYMLTQMSL